MYAGAFALYTTELVEFMKLYLSETIIRRTHFCNHIKNAHRPCVDAMTLQLIGQKNNAGRSTLVQAAIQIIRDNFGQFSDPLPLP